MSTHGAPQPPKLVSIALPIWKRLEYLPNILKIIEAQDYPAIELIVSDNGENGAKVHDLVKTHYTRPFRFRQNPETVDIARHFNQIFEIAAGEYITLICDDDEVSSNYISTLVQQLDENTDASIAFARQEMMNEDGVVIRRSNEFPVQVISGAEFIRGLWQTYAFGFEAIGTFLARTALVRERGGYPDFAQGNGIDNALVTKLCLDNKVALNPNCVWRWRVHETGLGWSVSPKELAAALIKYMRHVDSDPVFAKLAAARPTEWRELRRVIIDNQWQTYFWRWKNIYKKRMSWFAWAKAAFAMPFVLPYYRNVASVFRQEAKVKARKFLGISPAVTNEAGFFERHP